MFKDIEHIMSGKLTKKFFMELPENVHIASNIFIQTRSRPLPHPTSRTNAFAGSLWANGSKNDDGSIRNVFWWYAL